MIGEKEFNSCKKFPAGKRIVKLNLKPDTELGDLISWISSITCKQFLLPGTIPANSKKVTIVAPQLITPEEAYRLFLAALDSVGLTVQPAGKFLRIIETLKAKSAPIPLYGEDSDVPRTRATSPAWCASRTPTSTRWRRCSAASRASRATSSSTRRRAR